jgi:transcription-repair coupling factor (superfamily II helicase)
VKSAEDCTDVLAELESKLGKAPQPVKNLIDIAYTKSLASKLKVTELLTTDAQAYLLFDNRKDIMDSEALGSAIYKFASSCALELTDKPKIKFTSAGDKAKNYALVKEFLKCAISAQK